MIVAIDRQLRTSAPAPGTSGVDEGRQKRVVAGRHRRHLVRREIRFTCNAISVSTNPAQGRGFVGLRVPRKAAPVLCRQLVIPVRPADVLRHVRRDVRPGRSAHQVMERSQFGARSSLQAERVVLGMGVGVQISTLKITASSSLGMDGPGARRCTTPNRSRTVGPGMPAGLR